MQPQIRETADGSSTLFAPALNQHYHSTHGAVQESLHVFIEAGLHHFKTTEIAILEIGFGSGLNAFLTLLETQKAAQKVTYTAVEKFPISNELAVGLNYADRFAENPDAQKLFAALHSAAWEVAVKITPNFTLVKQQKDFLEITDQAAFDVIYFDAFSPEAQPELWTEAFLTQMHNALKPGCILVTYCAKGQVKRNLKAAGFMVETLPGPPGKREMTRAVKIADF